MLSARRWITSFPTRRTALPALALAMMSIALTAPSASQAAESFGQIGESWGSAGTSAGKFNFAEGEGGMFGVDPVDGSVYVGDYPASKRSFRVQEFTPEGALVGAVEIPRFLVPPESVLQSAHGVAVDHAEGKFYVLIGCKVLANSSVCQKSGGSVRFAATKLLVFKTQPQGSNLVLEKEVELPAGADQVFEPRAVAVDPADHELEVLGNNAAKETVLQRFKPTGELGPRFVDVEEKLSPKIKEPGGSPVQPATSIAIGPDGTTYLVTGGPGAPGSESTRAWELPESLAQVSEVPHFAEAAKAEGWTQGFLGREFSPNIGGPQIAVSPDGSTLYWKEVGSGAESEVIRGYSLTENATRVVYGGGVERCRLKEEGNGGQFGLSATGDRVVAINYEAAKVTTFGPGGTGCPTPTAQFSVNGKEEEGVAVEAEVPVTFDASGSSQEGEPARALVWNFGDGKTQTVECEWTGTACQGEEVSATTTHKYLSSGTFTVSLQYKLEHPVFGNPPPVTHTVEVTGGGSGAMFKLSVAKLGGGFGTVISERGINCGLDCENEYREGKSVTLSAFPQAGSTFLGWGGACVGSGTCTVSLSGPKAITATFEAAPAPPVVAPAGGGAAAAPAPAAPAPTTPVKHKPKKTAAQKLKEKKQKALRRCKKLKGKRQKAQCVKKASSPAAKHPKASGSGS
jgi:hypothetical protein